MRIQTLATSTCLLLVVSIVGAAAQATGAAANLSGNYRCEPQPATCRSGTAISVTQNGAKLELKNEKGEQADGQVTSNITVSVGGPWNMMGVMHDGAIEWSNGTKWRKQ
jgi:hypothetical protein